MLQNHVLLFACVPGMGNSSSSSSSASSSSTSFVVMNKENGDEDRNEGDDEREPSCKPRARAGGDENDGEKDVGEEENGGFAI